MNRKLATSKRFERSLVEFGVKPNSRLAISINNTYRTLAFADLPRPGDERFIVPPCIVGYLAALVDGVVLAYTFNDDKTMVVLRNLYRHDDPLVAKL